MIPNSCAHRVLVLCLFVFTLSLLTVQAQIPWATEGFSRQNKFEVYGIGQYLHQDEVRYSGSFGDGLKLTLDDTGLGGVGFAYHFNDYFSVHADFMFGPADFTVTDESGNSYSLGEDGYITSGRFNIDYNIINRRLTPFLTAGIGYQYMQVEEDDFYYDGPYYDYYYYSYYGETDFTWNVGAGVRWNITDNLFIKITGGAQWLKYEDADDISTQIEAFFAVGATFP